MPTVKPFGTWPSPVTAESLSAGLPPTDIGIDETTRSVFWCQVVPEEQGRGQIFSRSLDNDSSSSNDPPRAWLSPNYSCRTRVHEYGGGSFTVKNGLLIFSNDADARLYAIRLDSNEQEQEPVPVTPESSGGKQWRYADMALDPEGHRFLVCVQEEHFPDEEPKDVVNRLVAIDLTASLPGQVTVVAEGHDFYASPRLFGLQLAYVCWDHSNMPWDHTQLCLAELSFTPQENISVRSVRWVAGKSIQESVVQPEFGVDGTLYFASDRSGYWNLYRYDTQEQEEELVLFEPLPHEFAGAAWKLNNSWYRPFQSDASRLACTHKNHLALIDTKTKTLTRLDDHVPYTHFGQLRSVSLGNKEILVMNASSPTQPVQLISYTPGTTEIRILHESAAAPKLDPAYISVGREFEFPTENDKTTFAYFYEPRNPEYTGPEHEKPPLRVVLHGGPTAATTNAFSYAIQYWTTRGFAVADVNYGGSTGYGREYRNRLKKNWGIVDVDDCCNCAKYLAAQGWVDGNKMAIEGGSAGGFTVLASVAFRDVFQAGCCLYGISDIVLLAKETHKFESHYPDQLIGKYPEDEKIYKERSPLFAADKIKCPVIFFQGAEDKVVPPSQAQVMVDAMKKSGVPVAYVLYEGEGHGFRRAENIKRTMELEQWFYGQIFGFPVEGVQGIEIHNFPPRKQ